MNRIIKDTIHANGIDIGIYTTDFENEFISLTDIARYKSDEPKDVIKNWMRSKDTLEFLGLWEQLHNSTFKGVEFDAFRNQAGSNAFTMSPSKWIDATNAIGIVSKSGRYGGTFAHSDIAFEFASWVSPEFKLYIIKDYKRLKTEENSRLSLSWNLNREISKLNYRVHTDAIKENLIPPVLTPQQISYTYASEAGHIVLDHTGHSDHEEDEANFFAKYAIAPPVLVHKIGAECPQDIYEAFDISFEAAVYAYKYYCSWESRFEKVKRLADYEIRLLALFKKSA